MSESDARYGLCVSTGFMWLTPSRSDVLCVDVAVQEGVETTIRGKGRHDPCVLPRAVSPLSPLKSINTLKAALYERIETNKLGQVCHCFSTEIAWVFTTQTCTLSRFSPSLL